MAFLVFDSRMYGRGCMVGCQTSRASRAERRRASHPLSSSWQPLRAARGRSRLHAEHVGETGAPLNAEVSPRAQLTYRALLLEDDGVATDELGGEEGGGIIAVVR